MSEVRPARWPWVALAGFFSLAITGMIGVAVNGESLAEQIPYVIAGAIGGGGRLEYTVIGDAVNVAERLQSEAEGGEIVASSTTIASAPGISSEPIGSRQVKGREEPVEVFRVPIIEQEVGS